MKITAKVTLRTRLFLLLWLLLFWPVLLPSANAQFPAHIDTAVSYFGAKERIKENHGPDIKKFLNSVGLEEGYPYCAAFVSYCLQSVGTVHAPSEQAAPKIIYPTISSAVAQDFITEKSIDAKKVLRGQVTVPSGWIHIMKRGDTPYGHTGFVLLPWSGKTGITIDANTGTGLKNESERDGQGVWIRQRQIYSSCYFCIKKFTPVYYSRE